VASGRPARRAEPHPRQPRRRDQVPVDARRVRLGHQEVRRVCRGPAGLRVVPGRGRGGCPMPRGRRHGLVRRRGLLRPRHRGRDRLADHRPAPPALATRGGGRVRGRADRLRAGPRRGRLRPGAGAPGGDRGDPHDVRRDAGRPRGAQGHDQPADRPVRRRGRAGDPGEARRRPADPVRRAPGRPRRVPGGDGGAQGAGRALRHVRGGAGRHHGPPAPDRRRAGPVVRGGPGPPGRRPATRLRRRTGRRRPAARRRRPGGVVDRRPGPRGDGRRLARCPRGRPRSVCR